MLKRIGQGIKRLLLGVGLLVGILGLSSCSARPQATAPAKVDLSRTTPTLFFHGWGSSYHAEEHMAQAAMRAGASTGIIRAEVSKAGKVRLVGTFKKGVRNPIVEVNYQDNKNGNYHTDGRWAKNVVVALQRTYHIRQMNMVGHSMGNMAIVYYLLDNAHDPKLPKLQKQVDIAGHFNGILGVNDEPNRMKLAADGRPTKLDADYRGLLKLRQRYPKNQIKVLNIYGDKNDGTHSDGDVSNASSISLRYLVAKRAKSYQEEKILGARAQHSRLHDNPQVDKLLLNFLWK